MRPGRVPILEYAAKYSADTAALEDTDYRQLHFDEVIFDEFPDTDKMDLLLAETDKISVEDTLKVTENWLRDVGRADQVDLQSELAFSPLNYPDLELEEDKPLLEIEPGLERPLFCDYISQLSHGEGALLDRPDCYMMMTQVGISGMSDGKVSEYVPLQFGSFEEESEKLLFPCWNFSGWNRAKDEQIELFVDVFTGDVYYYTFTLDDETYGIETQ